MLARAEGSQNLIVVRAATTAATRSSPGRAPAAAQPPWLSSPTSPPSRALEPERAGRRAPRPASRVEPEFVTPHYLRFVDQRPARHHRGASGVLASHDINIDAVLQHPVHSKEALPFVVTTEACPRDVLADGASEIARTRLPRAPPVDLPMLIGGSEG